MLGVALENLVAQSFVRRRTVLQSRVETETVVHASHYIVASAPLTNPALVPATAVAAKQQEFLPAIFAAAVVAIEAAFEALQLPLFFLALLIAESVLSSLSPAPSVGSVVPVAMIHVATVLVGAAAVASAADFAPVAVAIVLATAATAGIAVFLAVSD